MDKKRFFLLSSTSVILILGAFWTLAALASTAPGNIEITSITAGGVLSANGTTINDTIYIGYNITTATNDTGFNATLLNITHATLAYSINCTGVANTTLQEYTWNASDTVGVKMNTFNTMQVNTTLNYTFDTQADSNFKSRWNVCLVLTAVNTSMDGTVAYYMLANRSYTIDNEGPVIHIDESLVPGNQSTKSGSGGNGSVTFNISALDAPVGGGALLNKMVASVDGIGNGTIVTPDVNCSIYINGAFNETYSNRTTLGNISTNGVVGQVNMTQASKYITINFVDGQYDWYITCKDAVNHLTTTNKRVFWVDTINPGTFETIKRNDDNTYLTAGEALTPPDIPYGTDLTINCSHFDATTTNQTTRYFSVLEPGNADYRNISTHPYNESANLGVGSSTMITYTATERLGNYIARCTACDSGNSCNKTDFKFNVVETTNGGGSALAASRGRPSTTSSIGYGNTENVGAITSAGTGRLMAETSTAQFGVKGTTHSLTVTEVGKDYVKVRLQSEPIELEIKVKESKTVDLDGDKAEDIEVTLNGIFGKKADITIKELAAEAPAEELEEGSTEPALEPERSRSWIWILVVVVIVIALIAYFAVKKKK